MFFNHACLLWHVAPVQRELVATSMDEPGTGWRRRGIPKGLKRQRGQACSPAGEGGLVSQTRTHAHRWQGS
jgi:hypothetical protein